MCSRGGEILCPLRCLLIALLVAIVSWQTYQSLAKYLEGDLVTVSRIIYPRKQTFPSVSICPLARPDDSLSHAAAGNWTFREELESMPRREVVVSFNHEKSGPISLLASTSEGSSSNADDADADGASPWLSSWRWRPHLEFSSPNLTECVTYTPPVKISPGWDSRVSYRGPVGREREKLVY